MFVKRIDQQTLIIGAPAKINLFLQVLNKRPDGFHNINSLFQAVSLFDRLKFRATPAPGIRIQLTSPAAPLPLGEDNLISRAYRLMHQVYNLPGGLEVELEKNIPIGAGLAGGSADAAATLLACNLLYDIQLDRPALAGLGARIGSDLPFFFSSGQALVTGRGEIITDTPLPTDYWLLLITPPFEVSTARSYADLGLGLTLAREPFSFIVCQTADELIGSLAPAGNDFEANHLVSYPEIRSIRDWLLAHGALLARMSGSGPTVFGIYSAAPPEEHDNVEGKGVWRFNTVRPITLGSAY